MVSAIVAPLWGSLADRKGRKLMLLRAALGMSLIMGLQGMATNVWQLFMLRALMGLTSGYIPNAMALIASQVPRSRSGWALGTLSTGQVAGVLIGPLLGGFMADTIGLRMVFFITSAMLFICFLITLFAIRENAITVSKKSAAQRPGRIRLAALPATDYQPVRHHHDDSDGERLHQPHSDAVYPRPVA
ncbi:hypothetical protein OS11_10260 [Dickeya oryzae]